MTHFQMDLIDPAKLIKVNDLKEIVNPIYFVRPGVPSDDGLLSNTIFGITKDDRAGIFAYIDLYEWFLNPLIYKLWSRMDNRIKQIVFGTKNFRIGSSGEFIEDEENGETGINFLRKNIDKISIRSTDSEKREINIQFIKKSIKDKTIFIKQYPVIPAYYRDVNSTAGKVGVGEINQMYDSLLIAVSALKETADYGLSMSNATKGRIEETILKIYNWLCDEPNISKKKGIMRRAVMSKTADYASRLVLSAPELKVQKIDDLLVDVDHSAVPLASVCTNLFPYIVFWCRRFFENEFSGTAVYPYREKGSKEVKFVNVKDPLIEFSDERIKRELERFIKGYSNRFIPILVPNQEGKKIYMKFKGRNISSTNISQEEIGATPLLNRKLTWCDIFYMAAVEVSKDKVVLITRYPMDSYFNQFPTKMRVNSTKDTEPMFVNNTVYKHYPKIRDEDIGSDTSNKFVDTLNISNLVLGIIKGK